MANNESKFKIMPEDSLELLKEKREYLKALEKSEDDRRAIFDTKFSQLVGQTGVIFTIVGLFISNYLSKIMTWPICFMVIVLITLLAALIFFMITIFRSTNYINVKNYSYSQRNALTIDDSFANQTAFIKGEINDLKTVIKINKETNSYKAGKLISAYNSFKTAMLILAVLIAELLGSAFISQELKTIKISFAEPLHIVRIDTTSVIKKLYINRDSILQIKELKIDKIE